MHKLLRRLRYIFRQRRLEAELREELESHRRMREQELEARGASAADAAYASRRALGNTTLAREDARRVWIWPWLESLSQDSRYAVRSLARQPGFTAIALGTLAAAIGLNTSFFTVFGAAVFRPWPVPEPDRVVRVFNGYGAGGFSHAAFRHLAANTKTFDGLFAARSAGNNVIGEDRARVFWVTGDYFRVLRVPMAMGRPFSADDDRLNAPAVAVLSEGYWQRRFGGDPSVVGKTISIEDVPVTVLGVAARAFAGTTTDRMDLWMPMFAAGALRPNERWVRDELRRTAAGPVVRGTLSIAGRLAPGVTVRQAESELALLAAQLQSASGAGHGVVLTDTTALAGPKGGRPTAFANMFAAVMLVLLLACANVGNLLLARSAARRREVAVRLSLGASRARVVRQLLTESFVLAGGAAIPGLLIASYLPRLLTDAISGRPTALQLEPDALVLGYTLVLCAIATLLFGLAPALHATRTSVAVALKDDTARPGVRFSLRGLLLSAQVALSVVLVVAAALLLRGVRHARGIDHGFDLDAVSVVTLDVPVSAYDAQRTRAFSTQLAQEIEGFGGGDPVAITQAVPFAGGNIKGSFEVPGRAEEEFNTVFDVSPRYFDVLGIPLVAGRMLAPADAGRGVVLVNESLARRLWTIEGAVGQRIVAPANGWNMPGELEIVGVVRDAHNVDLLNVGPTIYQPYSGRSVPFVLTRAKNAAALEQIAAAVRRIDPRVRTRVAPLSETVDSILRGSRLTATLASAVGLLALTLASIGMFGVFAFWVQQRTREIGIRMALGARAAAVVWTVLASSGRSIASGLVVGSVAAIVASGLLRRSLFGLSPLDPIAYLAAVALLTVAAVLATLVPARRAVRVDPVVALRHE
jgi:macrolide transport system ATP-binding/permease protein